MQTSAAVPDALGLASAMRPTPPTNPVSFVFPALLLTEHAISCWLLPAALTGVAGSLRFGLKPLVLEHRTPRLVSSVLRQHRQVQGQDSV